MAVIVIFALQCKKDKAKPSSENQIKNQAYTVLADSFFVPLEVAEIYAAHMNAADTSYHGEVEREIESEYPILDEDEIPCMWVFNYVDSGWVILSADYRCEPIMAFGAQGIFAPDTIPGGLGLWIDASIESINLLRTGDYDNTFNGVYAWETEKTNGGGFLLSNGNTLPRENRNPIDPPCYNTTGQVKGPLLLTTWGQECTYNNSLGYCNNVTICNHQFTGCVATAIAQVLHYYNTGAGGFNYSSMPLHNGDGNVSNLMADVGGKVNMNYNCNKSGANWNDFRHVFEEWYQFSNNDYGSYSFATVVSNILNNKPVILRGCAVQTSTNKKWWQFWKPKYDYDQCHAWVCDGVTSRIYCGNTQYELLHMNWGWHEVTATTLISSNNDYNNWYRYNNWTIPGGTNYQFANDMVYNITP